MAESSLESCSPIGSTLHLRSRKPTCSAGSITSNPPLSMKILREREVTDDKNGREPHSNKDGNLTLPKVVTDRTSSDIPTLNEQTPLHRLKLPQLLSRSCSGVPLQHSSNSAKLQPAQAHMPRSSTFPPVQTSCNAQLSHCQIPRLSYSRLPQVHRTWCPCAHTYHEHRDASCMTRCAQSQTQENAAPEASHRPRSPDMSQNSSSYGRTNSVSPRSLLRQETGSPESMPWQSSPTDNSSTAQQWQSSAFVNPRPRQTLEKVQSQNSVVFQQHQIPVTNNGSPIMAQSVISSNVSGTKLLHTSTVCSQTSGIAQCHQMQVTSNAMAQCETTGVGHQTQVTSNAMAQCETTVQCETTGVSNAMVQCEMSGVSQRSRSKASQQRQLVPFNDGTTAPHGTVTASDSQGAPANGSPTCSHRPGSTTADVQSLPAPAPSPASPKKLPTISSYRRYTFSFVHQNSCRKAKCPRCQNRIAERGYRLPTLVPRAPSSASPSTEEGLRAPRRRPGEGDFVSTKQADANFHNSKGRGTQPSYRRSNSHCSATGVARYVIIAIVVVIMRF